MLDRFYDDLEIGTSATYGAVTVTETQVATFGLLRTRPDTALAFYGMDQVAFHRPALLNDTLSSQLTVVGKTDTSVGGLVEVRLDVINQRQEIIAVATPRVLVASAAYPGWRAPTGPTEGRMAVR